MRARFLVLLASGFLLPGCLTDEVTSDPSERPIASTPDGADLAPSEVDPTIEGGPKVKICHVPPGNPGNAHTINVASSAVAAHLAHGDTMGPCPNQPPPQVCPPGEQWQCYTAPLSTDAVGVCQRGIKTCLPDGSGYGPCVGEITPSAEVCDGLDNDCDGTRDEACSCTPGSSGGCYTGPAGTEGVGLCRAGTHVCAADGSGFGLCSGEVLPATEVCGDNLDNDCDGNTDEGCLCPPGEEWQCYTGPSETDAVGACHRGIKTCAPDGMSYGACVGEQTPVAEICGNNIDDDCDGVRDDGCSTCVVGSTIPCYDGPPGTQNVGVCTGGVRVCDGTGYGACVGSVTPGAELCGDLMDNDCDGVVNDNCTCAPGSTRACYDGPDESAGIGTCAPGTQTCNATGTGYGACAGSVLPVADVCGDGLDNDCDGAADDGCVCAPGSQASCYDGPPDTEGVGTCTGGVQTCAADGSGYGACAGSVAPIDEVCGDGLDNDCDGVADDRCVCLPGTTETCYEGPPANAGVGVCALGSRSCNATGTGYSACTGSVLPSGEVCGNGLDDDCDGLTDEGCIGDRAWIDRNANGLQDGSEVSVAGATFLLRTSAGALVQVVTSNVAGTYWFTNVPAGTYYIEVISPVGYSPTSPNVGANDTIDSDFDDDALATGTFTFSSTGTITHIDCGFRANSGT